MLTIPNVKKAYFLTGDTSHYSYSGIEHTQRMVRN